MTTAKTCLVSPWTVLMAVRYGLGRGFTSAHIDALALAREHWLSFPETWRNSIMSELHLLATDPDRTDVRDSSARMLEWCREVETAGAGQAQR